MHHVTKKLRKQNKKSDHPTIISGGIFRNKEETTRRNNNIAALTEMNLDSQHFIQSVVDSYGAIVFQLEPPCMEEWMNRKD